MLNRENRAILKTLTGEYRKFAKKLSSAVFTRCEGSRAINENLSEMFLMLKTAQDEGRPFSETVPEPQMTTRETLLCFKPKRVGKIVALCAAIIAVICASAATGIVFYSNHSPITLDTPDGVFYSEKTNMIVWSGVQNASSYEVFINGNSTGETKNNSYFLSGTQYERAEYSFTVSVVAKGEGRYRDSKPSKTIVAESGAPMYEGDLSYFLAHTESGIFTNGSYIDEISKELFTFNAYSTAYEKVQVRFTPEYSFWGKVNEFSAKYILFGENAQGSDEPFYFRAGTTYIYELLNRDFGYHYNDFSLSIDLIDYNKIPENLSSKAIAPGKTLILFGEMTEFAPTAYKVSSGNVTVAPAWFERINLPSQVAIVPVGAYEDTFSPYAQTKYSCALYLLENEAQNDIALTFTENLITISAEDAVTMTLPAGYTAVRTQPVVPSEGGLTASMLAYYTKLAVYYYSHITVYSISPFYPFSGDVMWSNLDFNAFTCSWQKYTDGETSPTQLVLYVDAETKISMECFSLDSGPTVYIDGSTATVRLRPGLNNVLCSGTFRLMSGSSKWIFWNLRPSREIGNSDFSFGYEGDLSVRFLAESFGSSLFLNPYDEEIELTVTELVAKD